MSRSAEEAIVSAVTALPTTEAYVESTALSASLGIAHATLVDTHLKSLSSRMAIRMEAVAHVEWEATAEGVEYAGKGTPEKRVYEFVRGRGGAVGVEEVVEGVGKDVAGRGRQQGLRKRWIAFDQASTRLVVEEGVAEEVEKDAVAEGLRRMIGRREEEKEMEKEKVIVGETVLKEIRQRKLAKRKERKTWRVYSGERIAEVGKGEVADLTKEMVESGRWKESAFKRYNFAGEGKGTEGGYLHTLLKVREQFREVFLEMGFEEMRTNNYVESSFWNFDSLFQPQQHPARDEHDTFFLSDPGEARIPDRAYMERVRATHEDGGGYGSRGYRYPWSESEARRNILRTHTTAVSSRMLYALAQKAKTGRGHAEEGDLVKDNDTDKDKDKTRFPACKMFSIDRVFRNETLDATHLAEFHQIEGLVADRGLSLGDLKGIIHAFFRKVGMTQLRFKPTHNPYTTPSLEIHAFHEGLNKWVEVGNSGVFRPEMMGPMGVPADVTVIAWGLSLERPTMIRYGVHNIRDLFGYKVDIAGIQRNPLCRMTF